MKARIVDLTTLSDQPTPHRRWYESTSEAAGTVGLEPATCIDCGSSTWLDTSDPRDRECDECGSPNLLTAVDLYFLRKSSQRQRSV